MAGKEFEVARKYLVQRVSDALNVCQGPDAPAPADHLKTLENDICNDVSYVRAIESFLRGVETVDDGTGKTKVRASPPVLFFTYVTEGTAAQELRISQAGHDLPIGRTVYALRTTPLNSKGLPKAVSNKELDVVQDICIGMMDLREEAKGAERLTFLDFHRQLLKQLYEPMLLKQAKWGKATQPHREAFHESLRLFVEKLEDISESQLEAERLQMPDPAFTRSMPPSGVNYVKSATDPKLVKHFEGCVENWVGVATRLIQERPEYADMEPQNIPEEVGPLTELRWWKERCAKFNTIIEQLQAPEVKVVIGVLGAARSPVVKQWREIDVALTDASNEAKENIRYLSSLEKFFEALERDPPSVILNILPALVNNILMMYTIARYYSSDRNMMVLFCKITNQLIVACKNDIRQGRVSASHLWSQTEDAASLRKLIERLNACIDLKACYVREFRSASQRLEQQTGGRQLSSVSSRELHIFGKFELFCKRVLKLIEIFDTIEQFKYLDEYNIDGMGQLILRFYDYVEDLKKKSSHDPLDQSTPTFDKAFIEFNRNIAELESSLQVFINSSFENITSTENALALLKKFKLILNRKTLRSDLESKYMVIFHNYGLDLENVQKTYDRLKHAPSMVRNVTPVAGSIIWGRQLLRRIEAPMHSFNENKSMGTQKESKKIIRTYNKIARALVEFELVWLNAWQQSIENMKGGLNATLLVRSEGKLFVNFDLEILQLIKESRAIMRMGIPIPQSAKMVLMQDQKFKAYHGQLTHAIKEYDSVVSRIIPVTRSLMSHNLEVLDEIIRPGEVSLTWTSMNIDLYISSVHQGLEKLDVVVSHVNNIVQHRIQANLKFISSALLVNLPENQSFSLEQFVSLQEKHIKAQSEIMDVKNCEVEKASEDVITAILAGQGSMDGETGIEAMQLKTHFNNLMFKAILGTTTRSLNLIKKRVGTRGNRTDFMQVDKPFFDVNVELVPPHVILHPSLEEVQKAINQSATAVLKCSKYISPWKGVDGTESFFDKIAKNKEIVKVVLLLTGGIHGLKKQVMDYLNSFKRYDYLWLLDKQAEYEKFLGDEPTLARFEQELKKYKAVEDDVDGIQPNYVIGSLSLDTGKLKQALKREAQEWKAQYAKNLHQKASRDLTAIQTRMMENLRSLEQSIHQGDSLEDLRMMMDTLRDIRERESEADLIFEPVQEMYSMLKANNVVIPKDEEEQVGELRHHWRNLRAIAQRRNDEISKLQNGFKARLTREVESFGHTVAQFRDDFEKSGPMCEGITPAEAMERLKKFQRLFEDHKRSWITFQAGEELFGMPVHQYPELVKTEKELGLLEKLYSLYVKVIHNIKGYSEILWADLKQGGGAGFAELVEQVNTFQVQAGKLPKALRTWDAYLELRKYIDDFLGLEEMTSALAHPAMRERHWKTIMQITGTTWKLDEDQFKLANILEAKLLNFEEEVQDVTMSAQKEADIERKYKDIEKNWKHTELVFGEFKHRGQLVLKGDETNQIKEALEESQLQVGSMLASRFVAPFRQEVTEWMAKLSSVSEKLGLWQEVQSAWVWLEAVFAGGDIMKQLPAEAKRFAQIDKTWVKIMTKAAEQKNVIGFCYDNELLDLLPSLKDQLDQCQKQLQSYLETKRRAFPRFYFVSETVLLDILSQASDPTAIQGNIQSIFDGVSSVTFERIKPGKGETGSGVIKIIRLHSPEGESLQLLEPVPCIGNVENWLLALVEQMCVTVKEVAKQASSEVEKLQQNLRLFDQCLKQYPAQLSLLIVQMLWTKDVHDFLSAMKHEQKSLREAADRRIADLKEMLVDLTRTDLGKMERINVETLITIHVHQQDVWRNPPGKGDTPLKKLKDASQFDWLKQARFYFYPEKDEVVIKIADADTIYCNEYLGVKERLVITPLTDRCYITLSQALAMKLGGAPAGPAGTGKTETTKDLARTYGKLCIVTNCSDQLDYKAMGKIIKGLAQANAWGCFDEFNRIDLPVLSVVAQQIQSVLNGLKAHKTEFVFPDKDVVMLKPGVGFFITMNPGYAGRQELPENLKILFRGVTMMVPDRQAIMKVRLGGQGYKEDDLLSQKFYLLYNLCEQQLSKQRHYDFGLRNILSVLRSAGAVLRKATVKDEQFLFMRTLRDMNMSKLVFDDIDLFNSLLGDLFPGRNPDKNVHAEMEKALNQHVVDNGLIFHPPWVAKCIQLYETKLVRHGLMVVGPAGVGKTSIYHMVLKALCDLDERLGGMKHSEMRMNPKAITAPQMFGKLDAGTGDWHDGIFSALWRQACAKTRRLEGKKPQSVWLVCDGPVDAIWIENLNTVLDDNKLLTLASGDRLNMTENMKVCFEPENLNNASPATVSRAGIVYVSDAELGGALGRGEWKPWDPVIRAKLFASRKEEKIVPTGCPSVMHKEISEVLMGLYEKHVESCTRFYTKECSPVMPTGLSHQLINSYFLIIPLLNVCEGVPSRSVTEKLFWFSLSWSVGGMLDTKDRNKFYDGYVRHHCKTLPDEDTIFEYKVDCKADRWVHWNSQVAEWKYPGDRKISEDFATLFIPTLDSTRLSFLMLQNFIHKRPFLLYGGSGTSKTVTVENFLFNISKHDAIDAEVREQMTSKKVNFSFMTSPGLFQAALLDCLEKRQGKYYGPKRNKKLTLFIDDMAMPEINEWGDQITNEIVRQVVEESRLYSLDKAGELVHLVDMQYAGAMASPGGGKNDIPNRLKRHFSVFCVPLPSDQSLQQIFGVIIQSRFGQRGEGEEATPATVQVAEQLTEMSLAFWSRIQQKMLPTPAKFHYNFNLRDLTNIVQGMCMTRRHTITDEFTLVNLWKHECCRVFSDKLNDDADKAWYDKEVQNMVTEYLGEQIALNCSQPTYWVDFLREAETDPETGETTESAPQVYEAIESMDDLRDKLKVRMATYNEAGENKTRKLSLVLFDAAVKHVVRITRVLSTRRGNILLVGVGGSGKQSLTRLSASIHSYKTFQITVTKSYGVNQLFDDVREQYTHAGTKGPVCFIFTDNEIKSEQFLEYINGFLSSGEIPGLYSTDEKDAVVNDIRVVAKKESGREFQDTGEWLWRYFVNKVRSNLHFVLCMSPVGEKFRNRARKFPALISGCTIDWFFPWPEAALLDVSRQRIGQFKMETDQQTKQRLMEFMALLHRLMLSMSEEYFTRFRRSVFSTPKSYLSFLESYIVVYQEKFQQINVLAENIGGGLKKLHQAGEDVRLMKVNLAEKEVNLQQATKETDALLLEITEATGVAEKKESEVGAVKEMLQRDAAKVQIVRDDAEADLAQAQPMLEAANKALDSIDPKALQNVKKLQNPPALVKRILDGVCILLHDPIENKHCDAVPEKGGLWIKDSWEAGRKFLSDMKALERLQAFKGPAEGGQGKKDQINEETCELLLPYLHMEAWNGETATKSAKDVAGMCMWVRAMYDYIGIAKFVQPKMETLREAEATLRVANRKLQEKEAELALVQQDRAKCQSKLDAAKAKKQALEDDALATRKRMDAANGLIEALSGERERWTWQSNEFKERVRRLVGDVALSCAFISYCGPFNAEFRHTLLTEHYYNTCIKLKIPVTENISVVKFLTTESQITDWQIEGLPSDDHSVQNAIMITSNLSNKKTGKFPLIIDPQGQGLKWLRSKYEEDVIVTQLTDKKFGDHLAKQLQDGKCLIIENVTEDIDPMIDPVLDKAVVRIGRMQNIIINDRPLDYDDEFKMVLTTRLPNPLFTPELFAKTLVIDMTVTMQGLEQQLLGQVIGKEKRELEEERAKLVEEVNVNEKKLKEFEDRLLAQLAASKGNLIDDDELIATLADAKKASAEIKEKLAVAQETRKRITSASEEYRPVALRGSILYFLIVDMSNVSNMYQTSLPQFLRLFENSIINSDAAQVTAKRITNIINLMTRMVFESITRGLFSAHRLLFVLTMACKIKLHSRDGTKLPYESFQTLLKGGAALSINEVRAKPYPWIPDKAWLNIIALAEGAPKAFRTLPDLIARSERAWREWYDVESPETTHVPEIDDKLEAFDRLLIVRAMREDRAMLAALGYVSHVLGKEFADPLQLDFEQVIDTTNGLTPIIFLLSQGSDPSALIEASAKKRKKQIIPQGGISMGQGQEQAAMDATMAAFHGSGEWALLQNCHLGLSFLEDLEDTLVKIDPDSVGDEARVLITSEPHSRFPIGLLQMSIKLTNEPPPGIKAGIKRTYGWFNQEMLDSYRRPEWRPMLFAQCFLHSNVVERRKFGPIGFCIPYEFNQGDWQASVQFLQNHMATIGDDVKKGVQVSWITVRYMVSEIQYGGRITDNKDRVMFGTIAEVILNGSICETGYEFHPGYGIPPFEEYARHKEFMDHYPEVDPPEVFGLHANADIIYRTRQSQQTLGTILEIQPRGSTGSSGKSPEQIVVEMAADFLKRLPSEWRMDNVREMIKRIDDKKPLNIFCRQEIERLNVCIRLIRVTLQDLKLAIAGSIVMSSALQDARDALYDAKVPAKWEAVAWPGATMGLWFEEVIMRHRQLDSWVKEDRPPKYWLTGFYNPQGFLTSVRQEVTRAHKNEGWALDDVVLKTEVQRLDKSEVERAPAEGVYIHGLFLEGAGWDKSKQRLKDSLPKEPPKELPILYVTAVQGEEGKKASPPQKGKEKVMLKFDCPCYKYPKRNDINWIFDVQLNCEELEGQNARHFWQLRGVCLLCSID